jgi:hypothetical protein
MVKEVDDFVSSFGVHPSKNGDCAYESKDPGTDHL